MRNLRYDFKSIIMWLTVILLKHPISVDEQENAKNIETIYSSMWCFPSVFGKRCSFNNLCYNPEIKSFLFIVGKGTVFSGITSKKDLTEISTSWLNHSHFYLKMALIESVRDYTLISDRTVILSRFKPDNLMHVIHDDLLPLYVTFKRICLGEVAHCSSKTIIALLDDSSNSIHRLYEAFSYRPPIFLPSFNSVICFSNAYVGLDSDSIFYQYGYDMPQGPVRPSITGEFLFEFSEYILKFLHIKRALLPKCTLIGRKINRKILNEKYLVELMKDIHLKSTNQSIFVDNLDINSSPLERIISSVATSKLLLGMHGAGMILALFLPPESITLELFPYGIIREHVSPLNSLSKITGLYFGYFSWTNLNKEHSLYHPEFPYLLGGFESISNSEKERILRATSVPAVQCCHDPLYLHFMYQDTYVDYSIIPILKKCFQRYKLTNSKEVMQKTWYFPSHVRNIICSSNGTQLILSWEPPINAQTLSESIYRITLSCSDYQATYITKFSIMKVMFPCKDKFISVWVLYVANGIEGADSYLVCELPN